MSPSRKMSKECPLPEPLLINRIEHNTIYTYRQPVRFGQHRLVLCSREGHDLRGQRMEIEITPSHQLQWAHDIYNNSVAIVNFLEPAARLEIQSTVIVEPSLPDVQKTGEHSVLTPLPLKYDSLEGPVVNVYQSASSPEDQGAVRTWVSGLPNVSSSMNAEATLESLCSTICRSVKYQRRYAKGVQSPAETIQMSSGSCRDMATLMMDAARGLGMAARFASGYLDCPASEAGRAAMHAWTEVYLPIIGWRGYDPTLGEIVSRKHILVGVSHHPRGVMPISGLFTGLTGDYIDMTAQVKITRI